MFGRRKVVDEIALAGDEAPILDATHRRTYPGACDLLFSVHSASSCPNPDTLNRSWMSVASIPSDIVR